MFDDYYVKTKLEPMSKTRHHRPRFHPYVRHASYIPRIFEDHYQTGVSLHQTQELLMMRHLNQEPSLTGTSLYQTQRIPRRQEQSFQANAYSQQTARHRGSDHTISREVLLKLSDQLFENSVSTQELSRDQGNLALAPVLTEDHRYGQSTTSSNVLPHLHTGYTYPFLTFLLPSSGEDTTYGTESMSKLTKEHNKVSTSSTKNTVENLHPFHRRQLQTMAPSREGFTRTRDKYRVVYTEKQKKLLEEEYEKNKFLPETRRADLASETGLSERQIKFWFQNRRAKDKRIKTAHDTANTDVSEKSTSTTVINNTGPVIKDIRHSELPSCKYEKEPLSGIMASPTSTEDGQTTDFLKETGLLPSFFSGSCMYACTQSMNQSESLTIGSCRLKNTSSCTTKRSPTSVTPRLQKEYPASPSEWSITSQHSYLMDRVEMSPLFHGLQPSFDFRM